MSEVGTAMAKLAGIRKAMSSALEENVSRGIQPAPRRTFDPDAFGYYFNQTATLVEILRQLLPALYEDFRRIATEPTMKMAGDVATHYGREQVTQLIRDIDQVFEVRANSELSQPTGTPTAKEMRRVFVSHGRSNDWREVQAYIEKDIGLETLELAQEANAGQTIIEKLENNASSCDSAVIVMTGDDMDADGQARARENVMHEIGFFQAKYGRARVCLLHEENVSVPTNLAGVVYIPFPKGGVNASFGVLVRELRTTYKM